MKVHAPIVITLLSLTPPAYAAAPDAYPISRITILTSETGGAGDFASRLISQGLVQALGQPVIVENRSGVAPEIVAKAGPDGYTLLHYGNTAWMTPLLRTSRWDALRDFIPVSLTVRAPNVLVITPTLPVKSVKELISLAKARPGELNYASSTIGSSTHLAAEMFTYMGQLDIVRVNYKGVSIAVNDLISGRVQLMFLAPGAVQAHIKSGKLRALAVTASAPSRLFPGLPTVSESGMPGYESGASFGLFAPLRTPAAIVARLHQETSRLLETPEAAAKLLSSGMEVVASRPEEFSAWLKADISRWKTVIEKAGIRDD